MGGQGVLKLKRNLIFNSITMVLPLLPSLFSPPSSLLSPSSSFLPPPSSSSPLFLLPPPSSLPHRLDSELELIHTQQTELEDILSGLEEGLRRQPPTAGHHADLERTRTLVCNVMWPNTVLSHMSLPCSNLDSQLTSYIHLIGANLVIPTLVRLHCAHACVKVRPHT